MARFRPMPVRCGTASGPAFGTGYTNVSSYTTPVAVPPVTQEPHRPSDTPIHISVAAPPSTSTGTSASNTSGLTSLVSNITYVGSQGHFLQSDGSNARGFWADQLDPQYLSLDSNLALTGTALTNFCAANGGVCPSSPATSTPARISPGCSNPSPSRLSATPWATSPTPTTTPCRPR